MSKKFSKEIYVKIENESDTAWYVADDDAAALVSMGEKIQIATYQLVAVDTAEGVAKFGKRKK